MHAGSRLFVASLIPLLAAGCIAPVTERALREQLEDVAATHMGQNSVSRVVPIHADTRMAAWALLAEARTDESSPLSLRLGRGIALGASRRVTFVVGGPYPALSHQVVLNALTLNRKKRLSGLTLVLVGSEPPPQQVLEAAAKVRARLVHTPPPDGASPSPSRRRR
jgi:hypothetical protein